MSFLLVGFGSGCCVLLVRLFASGLFVSVEALVVDRTLTAALHSQAKAPNPESPVPKMPWLCSLAHDSDEVHCI